MAMTICELIRNKILVAIVVLFVFLSFSLAEDCSYWFSTEESLNSYNDLTRNLNVFLTSE